MKQFLTIISAIMLSLFYGNAFAQKSTTDDYNLKKAYEVLNEEKDEAKALDLVNKQLRETPDNVDALVLRVRLLRRKQDFGQALRDINHALKVNKPKKTEMQNSTLHWWKAYIYRDMGDNQNAATLFKTAYELAQKDDKDNLQSISFDYAQSLYDLEDLAAADAIYRKMLSLDEAGQAAMIGLARNMVKREQYKEAIELLDKCQSFDADYAEIYRFKMQAYDKMGEVNSRRSATPATSPRSGSTKASRRPSWHRQPSTSRSSIWSIWDSVTSASFPRWRPSPSSPWSATARLTSASSSITSKSGPGRRTLNGTKNLPPSRGCTLVGIYILGS